MPRGGKVNLKGRARHFTNPEELERQRREDQRNWRSKKEESEESSEEDEEAEKSGSGSEEESGDEAAASKKKDVAGGSIENPNRATKAVKKVDAIDTEEKVPLSRREREEIEKQRAREHYQKLHAQGKTEEARADLARLAIIKKQREEAAKKREEEKKLKEQAAEAKTASIKKAMGK